MSINDLHQIIGDYRPEAPVTPERIQAWLDQFGEDADFVLSETILLMKERYLSKSRALDFLDSTVRWLIQNALIGSNISLLSIQKTGKSQKDLISLFSEVSSMPSFTVNEVRPNFIYLDDCCFTGTTVLRDLRNWLNFSNGSKTNLQILKNGEATLHIVFFFLHYPKLKDRLYYLFKEHECLEAFNRMKIARVHELDKDDRCIPLNLYHEKFDGFKDAIEERHKQNISKYGEQRPELYYIDKHKSHAPFSSVDARSKYDMIMLSKSIEIYNKAKNKLEWLPPLGYTQKTERSFGFGAYAFTWRNVPNNTPLVFWYKGGGHIPLFDKAERGTVDYDDYA
ncbi:MAG: hypothetical protein SFY70_01765 [Bacteroidia bacterium]|nr:hypothetical protein [Bacteroidia bacterium]